MNDRHFVSIGEQHAGGNIYIAASDLNINQNPPTEDILQ